MKKFFGNNIFEWFQIILFQIIVSKVNTDNNLNKRKLMFDDLLNCMRLR